MSDQEWFQVIVIVMLVLIFVSVQRTAKAISEIGTVLVQIRDRRA